MTKSYCVRERKQTDDVPNSGKYVRTKNNRLMLKSSLCFMRYYENSFCEKPKRSWCTG